MIKRRCPRCYQLGEGKCDPYHKQAEMECKFCGEEWIYTLTDEERWTLIHGWSK